MGQRYHRMEDLKSKVVVYCHLTKIFVKGEGENQHLKNENVLLRRRVEKASVLKRITNGGLGAEPPAARQFCKFLKKKAILIPLDHISYVFTAI